MKPQAPRPQSFPEGGPEALLDRRVREALAAVPAHFRTTTRIDGLDANDLFSLNSVMGNTIEIQVVETLNRLRHIWDPEGTIPSHKFVRSAQTFPDVRLMPPSGPVLLGIELKGWYLLSKEGEPSFRYAVAPDACAGQDLLVVIPWHLEHVLAGSPVVHYPYVEQARYVAEYRDWWWTNVRETKDPEPDRKIIPPGEGVHPYPEPKTRIASRPVRDGGNNFGRIARLGTLMDNYVISMSTLEIAGILARHWIAFFREHAETRDRDRIFGELKQRLIKLGRDEAAADEIVGSIDNIVAQIK